MERVATKGNVIAVANLGDLAVQVCGRDWDDELWREYCEMIVGYVRRFGVPRVLFNFAPYHGPNASQRQILVEEYAERIGLNRIRRNALISDSRVVRGVMIALSWLSPEERAAVTKPFALRDHEKAFAWLAEDTPFDRREADRIFHELLAVVGYDPAILRG